MQAAQLTSCNPCQSLRVLYKEIDEKILFLTRQKIKELQYNIKSGYNKKTLSRLLHYKRIVERKIHNNTYIPTVDIQDIITQARILLAQ